MLNELGRIRVTLIGKIKTVFKCPVVPEVTSNSPVDLFKLEESTRDFSGDLHVRIKDLSLPPS